MKLIFQLVFVVLVNAVSIEAFTTAIRQLLEKIKQPRPTPPPKLIPKKLVVGGVEAIPNSIPWQVALVQRGERIPRCGGTIICEKFVMTAAHCIGLNPDVNRFQVLAGEHDLSDDSDGATRHNVKNISVHPDYIVKNRLVKHRY